ncbi:MAG: SGNH/GDSL hydrolase family protein [Sphingomicrobium sp.]
MARRIATARAACAFLGAALAGALTTAAVAQTAAPTETAPAQPQMTRACAPGATAQNTESPLPNVAAALSDRRNVRILAMGAAPGRVGPRGGSYVEQIERMLQSALKVTRIEIINRGVSGELAVNAALRMKNEVALEEPDLVLWQVGTNDALAYVPATEFAATVRDQVAWLKDHKVDVVLVGLQFAPQMLRDAHYVEIRETLRRVATERKVIVVRFFEAMQILNPPSDEPAVPPAEEFERTEAGYNCLSQYVARAITLGVFGKNIGRPAVPP